MSDYLYHKFRELIYNHVSKRPPDEITRKDLGEYGEQRKLNQGLSAAMQRGDVRLAEALLRLGANEVPDRQAIWAGDYLTPFVREGRHETVETLLGMGLRFRDECIEIALEKRDHRMLKLLMQHRKSALPRHLAKAIDENDVDSARILFEKHADPNEEYNGKTHLTRAVEGKHRELTELLLKMGAKQHPGHLAKAIENGDVETTRTLLEHEGDPNAEHDGKMLLEKAIETRNPELVGLLLERGANPNPEKSEGTPLCMIERALSIHRKPQLSIREALKALDERDMKIVESLLKHGARPRIDIAVLHPENKLAELMLEHGADPNSRTLEGNRILLHLLQHEPLQTERIKWFMERGALAQLVLDEIVAKGLRKRFSPESLSLLKTYAGKQREQYRRYMKKERQTGMLLSPANAPGQEFLLRPAEAIPSQTPPDRLVRPVEENPPEEPRKPRGGFLRRIIRRRK